VTPAERSEWERITRIVPGYDPWQCSNEYWFDYDRAAFVCAFFPGVLTHTKGEWSGRPLVLEDWQKSILANLFGWMRKDGTRRYRQSFIYVPRKNAKTTLAAGIALFLLFLDGEGGAEIYTAAANKDQAKISFDAAKGMVLASDSLSRRAKVFGQSITYDERMGTLIALTGKASTKHGLNPHASIIDELHTQKDRELVDTLTTAVGARRQPLTIYLTTADFGRPSICNETHDYACKVRDGVIDDPTFLPIIYEATRDDDWTDEKVWFKANPNLGVSLSLEFMREQCRRAKENQSYENTFKRLHLNIITEQANRWLSLTRWDDSSGELTQEQLTEALAGEECFAGLDLSTTTDLTALALIFPPTESRRWTGCLLKFWAPKEKAREREKKDRGAPYLAWSAQGHLTLTPGDVVDYDVIRADIGALSEVYNIKEIGLDRWAATHLANQLQADGFEMVGFGMGFASLSAPTKELEKLVLEGLFWHASNPVLRFCAANVSTEQDAAGNLKPSKKHSVDRIDGIIACIIGIGRTMARSLAITRSVYEDRGLDEV